LKAFLGRQRVTEIDGEKERKRKQMNEKFKLIFEA
jgi:hypothetical protein